MIIKKTDEKLSQISALESLIATGDGRPVKHAEEELRKVRAGIKGEQEAAYLIDFHFEKSKNTAVIHDLRLEIGGRVAQIDHLLIHRTLNIFVLETKRFHAGLKITDEGEFLRWNDWKKTFEGMPSPLAQNDRHIAVLQDAFAEIEMPTRLGIRLAPTFHNVVLVSPNARVDRSKLFDSSRIIKADALRGFVDSALASQSAMSALARMISTDTVGQIASGLAALHRPASIDYTARYGIPEQLASEASPVASAPPVPPEAQAAEKSTSAPEHVCRGCGSNSLDIQYGKFGYYLKCTGCDGNTPIKLGCGKEGHKERLRKSGPLFFRECSDCGSFALYFTNTK